MTSQYFAKTISIPYEGAESKNLLALKHYNANEELMGKRMKEHLRLTATCWHSFFSLGSDKFGMPIIEQVCQNQSGHQELLENLLNDYV